jgi:hypothetical protein
VSGLQAGMLGSAVNPKQPRVVTHNPQHKPLPFAIQAVIAIG